jgi:hypothetical protein
MPQIALAAFAIYQGVEANKQAKSSANAANAARQQEQAIGSEDQQYWRDKYGPVNQMLIDYAMGDKPSPYLAAAKGKVETGYQQGVTQLNELQGREGLQQSGIGSGQRVGLNMERAKAEAGLNLQDQAQRYGVAQALAPMVQNEQKGMQVAGGAVSGAASAADRNAASASAASGAAFSSAAGALGSAISGGEFSGLSGMFSGGDNSATYGAQLNDMGVGQTMSPISTTNTLGYPSFTPATVPQ